MTCGQQPPAVPPWIPARARGDAEPLRPLSAGHATLPWLADARPSPLRARPSAHPPPRAAVVARLLGGAGTRGRLAVLLAGAVALALVALWLSPRTGARTVATPFLSYTVPDGWTADAPDAAQQGAPVLVGSAHGPGYDCGGESYVRGFAAAALLPTDASEGSGPAERAERLARWFATTSYATSGGAAPEVTVAPPRPVRLGGPQGPVYGTITELAVEAGGRGDCPALRGTVLVLAAPVSGGAALLLVAGDAEGGPAEPQPPDRATLEGVLASVRLA